jgi:DNA-binding SARP family transcriptional activator
MLEIRLLGELEVARDGAAVPLPASKKSRALLAYLAATARPHLRERLCELLWEGPDDPRAALRWSLTKLRPLVDPHLVAARDRVEFRGSGAAIDIRAICTPANATTDQLEACAALFRGEFLDGLDLPGCFRYQQWCIAERERYRQEHVAVLTELTQRLGDRALPYARRRVAIDPFNEPAHAALIRLLTSAGQHQDAIRQYECCRSVFERELGTRPGAAVEEARRSIGRAATPPDLKVAAAKVAPRLVGRDADLARIGATDDPVIILGEPGIGKTRLLDEVRKGKRGVYGRAFAAEMIRPYGVWVDALGDFPAESDRPRLFEAVAGMLDGVAVIAIDDLQWIDEASAALLHYVARSTSAKIVCAARVGELDDNPAAKRLSREMRVIALGPLSEEDMRTIVSDDRAVKASGGNPLLALWSAADPAGARAMIVRRLDLLDGASRETACWAAAVGRQFDAEIVGRATGMPAGEMLASLERLERLAIIRPVGDRSYDFGHDLVRDAAYQMLSGPRRTLVHRQIARALRESHDPDGALAGEIVHHAALAGDHAGAAAAAVVAGNRCLRVFAYGEAISVARRGLQMTNDIEHQMQLLEVIVLARAPLRDRIGYSGNIAAVTELARRNGLAKTAALGPHLLAALYYDADRLSDAACATIESAELSRTADPMTAAVSMATSAQCLLSLERDIDRAESLLTQAQAIGGDNHELSLGLGLLYAHQGRATDAIPQLEHAFELASRDQDHRREWLAVWRLATVALEDGDAETALRHCQRMRPLAAKMKGGSEAVRSDAVYAVARSLAGHRVDLDAALDQLRAVDSKSDLAWVLCYLARLDPKRARGYATEALAAAEAVGRESEIVIARRILGLNVKPSRDIGARARNFLKETPHGGTRARTIV